jgi:hypothetical protein
MRDEGEKQLFQMSFSLNQGIIRFVIPTLTIFI